MHRIYQMALRLHPPLHVAKPLGDYAFLLREIAAVIVQWRSQLELVARLQWTIYRRHPWLVRVISMTRPDVQLNGMHHTEWALRALADLDMDPNVMVLAVVTLFSYVRGSARLNSASIRAGTPRNRTGRCPEPG